MPSFDVKADSRGLIAAAEMLAAAGMSAPTSMALVMNRTVTRARPRVVAAVAEKTGIFPKIISKAVRPLRASPTNLRAGLRARGGEISLRYFKAREENGGVVADVAGERVFIWGGFRRSGRAPNRRMVKRLNKQVYVNPSRRWRGEIEKERSGVFIPITMIEGESREAFEAIISVELPNEVVREIAKSFSGRARR